MTLFDCNHERREATVDTNEISHQKKLAQMRPQGDEKSTSRRDCGFICKRKAKIAGALLAVSFVNGRGFRQNVILEERQIAPFGCTEDVWSATDARLHTHTSHQS